MNPDTKPDINILSWNVCWECMTNNLSGTVVGTAYALGQLCTPIKPGDKKTICANNIIKYIDESSINFDIIGLQEASKWFILQKDSHKLRNMNYVHHQGGKEHCVTFYNQHRFILNAVKVGDITKGRPFQILFLVDKLTNENIICINLHNDHFFLKNDTTLQTKLSTNIDNAVTVSNSTNMEKVESMNVSSINHLISGKKFNVIFLGDTNDHGIHNFWKGFKPFGNSQIPNLKDLSVSSQISTPPPKTCCDTSSNPISHYTYGDYILISNDMIYKTQNIILPNYDRTLLTSDHTPVYASVNYKTQPVIEPQVIQPQVKPQVIKPVIPQVIKPVIQPQPLIPQVKPQVIQPVIPQVKPQVIQPVIPQVIQPVIPQVIKPVIQPQPLIPQVIKPVIPQVIQPHVIKPVIQPQPVIQPVIPLLTGDYKKLKRCQSKNFNIINKDMIYINKLNKLNRQDYTHFKEKKSINFTNNLYNDIYTQINNIDNIIIKEIKLVKKNKGRVWLVFDNKNKTVTQINVGEQNNVEVDLVIDNYGIGIQFERDGVLIKENIYLLFFLLNFDFKIIYNDKTLIDAFIDILNKLKTV